MGFVRVYGRVLGLLRADRRTAVTLAVANLLLAALQFVDPLLFGRVIGLLARNDPPGAASAWAEIVLLLSVWGAATLLGIGAGMAVALQADRLAHRNRLAAMGRFFSHVLALPLSFHGATQSGRLMKVMLSGTDAAFGLWLAFFREHLSTAAGILLLLPFTLLLNWRLALVLILLVLIFGALTGLVIHRTEAGQRAVETHHAALAGNAQDALANVMVVHAFTRLSGEMRRFQDTAQLVLAHQFPVLTWWAVVSVLTRAASTLAVLAIVLVGSLLHRQGQASLADIVSFIGFATLLIGRLEGAMGFVSRLFLSLPSLAEFFAVLDADNTAPDRPGARLLVVGRGAVAFEAVRFAYSPGTPALEDVSFAARPGSMVALVGHTGAGKSTAMALLQRFWEPDAGRVLIDGQDVRAVTLDSLRAAIGVVFQDSLLFNRSIRDNLLVGKPDATEAELERAVALADARAFILRQPQGFDTLIGERGVTLSGGQRQLLAIARAALKDPPILILDEATSALDAATEARVSRALRALMAGRTTLVIAHRLSTVRDADDILVFDHGRVVERGTFAALLARDGVFAALFRAQLPAANDELPASA